MKIIHIASEVFPYSKTGGLADVTGTLPQRMAAEKHKVMVFTPLYRSVKEQFPELIDIHQKVWVDVPDGLIEFNLKTDVRDNVDYIFFENEELFDRPGLYNENGHDYTDNHIRFSAFCMGCMNYIKHHSQAPDIIHAHDWQAALIPVYHKSFFSDINTKTVLTIHNLAFQGVFDIPMESIGLDSSFYDMEKLEFYEKVNLLKGGIVYSDHITTVSPTYADEIKTHEYGFNLDGLLKKYDHKLSGIVNGIDYTVWNPAKDPNIPHPIRKSNYNGKEMNKQALAKIYHFDSGKPLFSMVTRFTEQKGIQFILETATSLSKLNAHFIFLGDGTPGFNHHMQQISSFDNITVILGYNEGLSHQLYAAADFYLMPSVFEPCGLSQMIAMRYGTIPVVRKTGGLSDTVKDIEDKGYGLMFNDPQADQMLNAIERGIEVFKNNQHFKLSSRVMNLDFSWKKSAANYLKLYTALEKYQGD